MLRVLGAAAMLCTCAGAWSDDVEDIMALIDRYAELEGDLDAQAKLIRDDRVMIAGGVRQTDQDANMEVQQAQRDHRAELNGGPAEWIIRVEDPMVRVYGDTAVVSYVRLGDIFPPGTPPISNPPLWTTLVLVKERGDWRIAHTHLSPAGSAN